MIFVTFLVELEAAPTDCVLLDDEDDAGEGGGQLPHCPAHVLRVLLQTLLTPGRTLDDPDQPGEWKVLLFVLVHCGSVRVCYSLS